ncbi:MAG: ribosomal protein S18-alanine N-acetyltransferase [Acidimicrobiales bacterium]|nr:ribosomal protein S18-alanine N-acetyltransferase [Acidimicrobiales bacterium]
MTARSSKPSTLSELVIAPMRAKDLTGVLRIEQASFDEPWSRRLFLEEIAQRTSRVYRVAWEGRRVVGFGGIMLITDEAHVNNIAVDPERLRHGIGTALLSDLVHRALERGVRHLTLEVRADNRPAQDLYYAFGFAPVGVRPRYYPGGEDAIVMWARDVDGDDFAARLDAIDAEVAARVSIVTRH